MPQKFRIAILVDRWSTGGVPVVIRSHCAALAARGHRITILTYYPSETPENLDAEFISLNARHRGDVRVLLRLRSFLNAWQPDVIHDHFGGLWSAAFLFKRRWYRRAALHYHNEFIAVSDRPDQSRAIRDRIFLKYLLPRYRKTLTVSEHNRNRLLHHSPVVPESVEVCYNSIDPQDFLKKRGKGEDIRKKLGIPKEAVLIGSIGRMVYEKGFDTVVATLLALHKKNIPAYAFIAGDGDAEVANSLKNQARNAGLEPYLKLRDREPNTADYLRALDFFLMCSRQEPFGLTILEAMACETLVLGVLPEVGGGPAEIITNDKNGHLIAERDPEKLADKITELLAHPDQRKAMVAAATEKLALFHPEKTTRHLESLYHYMVHRK